jgi:hypothetical protein
MMPRAIAFKTGHLNPSGVQLDFVERTDTENHAFGDRMTAKHLRTTFAVVGCISLMTAAGCSRPKQYRIGEAIPIGSYTLSISMTEMTHLVHQRQLVVFYRCTGTGGASLSQSEREEFLSACRSPRFRLLDGRENEYPPEEVELAAMYRADRTAHQESYTHDEDSRVINPGVEAKNKKEADVWAESALHGAPEQWVVVFDVPEDATKFTLELKPSLFGSSGAMVVLDR